MLASHLTAGLLSLALGCLQLLPGLLKGIPRLTADLCNLHQEQSSRLRPDLQSAW